MSVKEARKSGLPIRLTLGLIVYMAAGMVVMATVLAQADSTGAIVMSVVLILMVLFAGVKLIDKWFIQPMLEFQSAVQRIGGIEGSGSPWVGGKDQWSALGRNLNNLVVRLKERIRVLEGERAKVTAILDSMVEGVIAVDGQGKILLLNPSARRILDLAQGGLEGQFLLEVVRNPELADVVESCGALETTEKCHREVELNLTHRRVLDVHAMPFLLSPDVRGVLIVLHDISELRRLEQVRSEFVANVSHELRTPLAAIKGYLETLLDEAPAEPKTYRRFLEGAHRHSERLARLLEDLHHLSDIESGRVVLHPKVIGLSGVVQEVTAIFEKEAAKREVALVNEIAPDPSAYADRDRLSQILVNLVDNALKYTSVGGQVRFSTGVAPDGQITLRIQDTGQGIPSTELPRLTERFFRVDKARSREEGGTGLGLAIVKHLVQLHGGTLHIESEFGKGTTVQFSLPISS